MFPVLFLLQYMSDIIKITDLYTIVLIRCRSVELEHIMKSGHLACTIIGGNWNKDV